MKSEGIAIIAIQKHIYYYQLPTKKKDGCACTYSGSAFHVSELFNQFTGSLLFTKWHVCTAICHIQPKLTA